jgi:glycosyltransferase involved in cell wall biosynthesis
MNGEMSSRLRVTIDGKFFRLGAKKFCVKGVTYGPFAPDAAGEQFGTPEQARRDFELISELGANTLRIYYGPPRWFLDLAHSFGLKLLVDIPWSKHLCFLEDERHREGAFEAVRQAVRQCAGHPAVFAFSVVNEIPSDIARWSGAGDVGEFLDDLVDAAKEIDPHCLCTMGNYPPTEFLRPRNLDFLTFNVYLHQQRPLENYLARLQMIADTKPIMLGEFGLDSIREGEAHKCEVLSWQIETAYRGGLAGAFVYAFTDDWFKDGVQITDWQFGLVTRDRQRKPSFEVVKEKFAVAPYFPLSAYPRVSVVVASYNGGKTLKACLESLEHLNYPDYEVVLVDDGSTDNSQQIAANYPKIKNIRQPNMGLSVARNTGIHAATGEIVAFTDSDCRADEDWLYYLIGDLLNSKFTGIGGHNFLPPEDSPTATCVMASPGGPAHVMLTDRLAEHIPGCNMAFYRWALLEIEGFDPIYRKAGDDVDVCWRLMQRGYRIGFSSAGFVWHYRRSTVQAYLKQQQGYGEAEALLIRKHPEYFNSVGGSIWHGRIYTSSKFGIETSKPIIYHGVFGSGFFQTLYTPTPTMALMMATSLEYHVLVTVPLLVLSVPFRDLLSLGVASALISIATCIVAGFQAEIPKNKRLWWSKPLVAALFFLQPIYRGYARYKSRLSLKQTPPAPPDARVAATELREKGETLDVVEYWAGHWVERLDFLGVLLRRLDDQGWQNKTDAGWSEYDVEIYGSRWAYLQLMTVAEPHGGGRQLFRVRLQTRWSLLAKVAFFSALAFELLIIGFVGTTIPWLWLLLLLQVLLAWFLEVEQRDLQRLIIAMMDDIARQKGLYKIDNAAKKKAAELEAAKFAPKAIEPKPGS